MGNVLIYPFALIWGLFDFNLIKMFILDFNGFFGPEVRIFGVSGTLFFILHLTPVWIAIFGPIYRLIKYHTVEYAITNRRVYIYSGVFGRDIVNIEHRKITDLGVNVNFLENMRDLGTINLAQSFDFKNKISKNKFVSIKNPYEVYKLLKKVSLDVTTDE